MKSFAFERLKVWQKARFLSKTIYLVTSEFPADERFGLTSQMRRSAISIASNIAEGSARFSKKEQARFTEIAYSSAMELLNQIILTKDLNLLNEQNFEEIREKVRELTVMLSALHKQQLNAHNIKT